jgi:hypothetical protein
LVISNPAELLSNPILSFTLRVALGTYVVFMARGFYADPLAYFRKWMPRMPEYPWMRPVIRGAACFCIWGGCFIVATAIVTHIFSLYGLQFAILLILLSCIATYFLLPRASSEIAEDESGSDHLTRLK